MKRQLTAPTMNRTAAEKTPLGGGGGHARGAPPARRARPSAGEPGLVLASVSTWTHQLVLRGELTRLSAPELEIEIERLCEEGVTDITLDLRQLSLIDATGVAVIAFRCGLCQKRGYGIGLIRGPEPVQRAFARAGLEDALPFRDADEEVPLPGMGLPAAQERELGPQSGLASDV